MRARPLILFLALFFLLCLTAALAQAQLCDQGCTCWCDQNGVCKSQCSGGAAIPTTAPTSPPDATPGPPGGDGGGSTPVPPGPPSPDVTPFPTPTPPQDRVCADEWFRCVCLPPDSPVLYPAAFARVNPPK